MRRLFDRRPEQSSSRDAEGGRSLLVDTLRVFLPISVLFQLALSTTQVTLGHSVGGLMYYLGERTIAVGQPNVALASIMGSVVLRAYATFSHPNILAGWAVVSLLILLRLKLSITYQIFCMILVSALVFLTQSRSAALALFVLVIPIYIIKNLKIQMIYFALTLSAIFYLLSSGAFSRPTDFSFSQRLSLQGLSSQVISTFPLFGTGAQASISTYPSVSPSSRLLQPDHNSFTLFLSWFGIFGVIAIIYWLRTRIFTYSLLLIPALPLLVLDHYFLTSPQGLFILLLYLRLALNYPHAQNDRQ